MYQARTKAKLFGIATCLVFVSACSKDGKDEPQPELPKLEGLVCLDGAAVLLATKDKEALQVAARRQRMEILFDAVRVVQQTVIPFGLGPIKESEYWPLAPLPVSGPRPPVVLRVCFKEKATSAWLIGLQEDVKRYAVEWEKKCNVQFKWLKDYDKKAEIRISFSSKDVFWSLIGSDSKNYPSSPSMKLGWIESKPPSDERKKRDILHEFGHALGMMHELNHPGRQIGWDEEKVRNHYRGLGWHDDDIEEQIIKQLQPSKISCTKFDEESIMIYPIPAHLLKPGAEAIEPTTSVSTLDGEFVDGAYPKNGSRRLPNCTATP